MGLRSPRILNTLYSKYPFRASPARFPSARDISVKKPPLPVFAEQSEGICVEQGDVAGLGAFDGAQGALGDAGAQVGAQGAGNAAVARVGAPDGIGVIGAIVVFGRAADGFEGGFWGYFAYVGGGFGYAQEAVAFGGYGH